MPSLGMPPEVHLLGVLSQPQTSPSSCACVYPTVPPSVLSSTGNRLELLLLQITQSSLTAVELPGSKMGENIVYLLNPLIN